MGQSYQGDISIDDISMSQFCRLYTGPIPTAPPPTTGTPPSPLCPGFRFKCANGPCIDPKNVCDYRDDCGDGSDEVNCGMLTSVSLKHLVNNSTQPSLKLAVGNEWILLQVLVRLSLVCAVGRITVWALISGVEIKVLLSRLVLDQVLTTRVEMLHVRNKSF